MDSPRSSQIIKFTNGLLLRNGSLLPGDIWISSQTGCIISPQSAFYSAHMTPDRIIDLNGKILSPGFIDVQLNGGYDFDFSVPDSQFASRLTTLNRKLVRTGVTSYLPTVTSQKSEVYHANLPYLGSSGSERNPEDGSESLGAHVEGPFLSPARNGIHNLEVLQKALSIDDVDECYGYENISKIRKITAAPELGNMTSLIPELTARGWVYSIGHSDASLEQAQAAIDAGASMVTHMFNAMRSFGHREPGIFGLLGQSAPSSPVSPVHSKPASAKASPISSSRSSRKASARSSLSSCTSISDLNFHKTVDRPFFGLIADGIHLSAQALKIAYSAYPEGAILVTDAMKLAGCPDGTYNWTNGERIVKQGPVLRLEKNDRIAGSAVTLIECVNNFIRFTGCGAAHALECVTSTPAKMLGADVEEAKGKLEVGMDADLVVLSELELGDLQVEQVWKFGVQVV